jgi:hypothetical protein
MLRRTFQKVSCRAVGFLRWQRKRYRARMIESKSRSACMQTTFLIIVSKPQRRMESIGPIMYRIKVIGCITMFQNIPHHIRLETSWFISVRWWLLRSNLIIKYIKRDVMAIEQIENNIAVILDGLFDKVLTNNTSTLK